MSFQNQVAKMTDEYGRDIIYRRTQRSAYDPDTRSAASVTTTEYSIKAAVRELKPHEIAGDLTFNDRLVRIAGNALPITPRRDDLLIIGDNTYRARSIDDIVVKGEAIQYKIVASGDAN